MDIISRYNWCDSRFRKWDKQYLLNNHMRIIPILWIKSVFYFILVSLAIIYYYASHNEYKSFKTCIFDKCDLPKSNIIFISLIATMLFLITNMLFIKSTQLSQHRILICYCKLCIYNRGFLDFIGCIQWTF